MSEGTVNPSMHAPFGHRYRSYRKDASVVFIGIQGVGKRTLAFIAAAHLGRRFVAEKFFFEELNKMTKSEYLDNYGEEAFQGQHFESIKQMLQRNQTGCVIECGTASVTRQVQTLLREYSQTNPVIHIVRCADQLARTLNLGPRYIHQLEAIYAQHRDCSNLEFYNLYDDTDFDEPTKLNGNSNENGPIALQWLSIDVQNYIDLVFDRISSSGLSPFSIQSLRPEQKSRSTCLSILLSEMISEDVQLEDLALGQDAIELCVDFWSQNFKTEISKRVGWIRRKYNVPIILSAEQHNGNAFAQNPDLIWEALNHGLGLLVDYIAVGKSISQTHREALLACKGRTRVILDLHYQHYERGAWLHEERFLAYQAAKGHGFDLIRMTQPAHYHCDNRDLQVFANRVVESMGIPLIAYNIGYFGKNSRLFNRVLTPIIRYRGVTTATDISIKDITSALFSSYEYDSLHFHIFGQSVSSSKTPAIYKAAFSYYGLQHTCTYQNVHTFEDSRKFTLDPFFGGAAISFPFKEDAFKSCVSSSIHASAIGSVNTIVPLRNSADGDDNDLSKQANLRNTAGDIIGFHGDNSDWASIYTNVRRRLSPRNLAQRSKLVGLVLGAGGSARSAVYALLQLDCHQIYIKNRTYTRARSVADHFNTWATENGRSPTTVKVLENHNLEWPANAMLPTVIVCCIPPTAVLFQQGTGKFDLPNEWLGNPTGGAVCDVSYVPTTKTPFLQQVESFRKGSGRPWEIITGIDIIYEQGLLQFEQLTGYRSPSDAIRQALFD